MNRLSVEKRPLSANSMKHLTGGGKVDNTIFPLAMMLHTYGYSPKRQTGKEVACAVNRVNHPTPFSIALSTS